MFGGDVEIREEQDISEEENTRIDQSKLESSEYGKMMNYNLFHAIFSNSAVEDMDSKMNALGVITVLLFTVYNTIHYSRILYLRFFVFLAKYIRIL